MTAGDPLRSVTIAGGGVAGFSVARELRANGFDGTLRIVDPEGLPYDRPPLSKGYLAGETTAKALLLAPDGWYDDNAVEIVTDSVAKLSPGTGGVLLTRGGEIASDAVVLATGGVARRLPVPGADSPAVHALRNRADADALRAALRPGAQLVVIGAGLIGAEVASTASAHGVAVTLVDPVPVPLVPALGPELAEFLHDQHAQHGVRVVRGSPLRITGTAVTVASISEPLTLQADVVLTAVGLAVDTTLAAGLDVDDGVLTDTVGRTSNPAVYAAGDLARTRLPDGTLTRRSEHWEAATLDGTAVARAIVGVAPQDRPPAWFWSDRYGLHVEAVGAMAGPGTTILREAGPRSRLAFRRDHDGRLVGCAAVNGGKSFRAARRLVTRAAVVDVDELRDPAVDLRKAGR
ncbi:MAG TPA: FAD-dependent oxidoreductase [Amycolatopsis sp.]|nr:FAD-dependent oxidoreductase [Amycolatopsis sp.]